LRASTNLFLVQPTMCSTSRCVLQQRYFVWVHYYVGHPMISFGYTSADRRNRNSGSGSKRASCTPRCWRYRGRRVHL
jgi:hypothetical protein